MKILMVNGSPHAKGCTYTALTEVGNTLIEEGFSYEIFQLGKQPLPGCIACKNCKNTGQCVFNDRVNDFLDMSEKVDGFIFGSPVHYAALSGAMSSFLDRLFYSDRCGGRGCFYLKPAAGVVSARRGGTTAALDQMNKYFTIAEMPIISSRYWNMVHGTTPEEVKEDLEGMQTMRILARNMAWFLKCKEIGMREGISLPKQEDRVATNFIR